MIPLYVELHGAIGIRAGLGRDSLKLDLREIVPSDAATVAIKGDNGSGKSTLLNLGLVPWREPPSLSGDIYAQFGPKGSRILDWTHGAETYRTEIHVAQTARTKSQKAFLYRFEVDRNVPVAYPDGLVSNGNLRTYDACLERILGPMDLYFLSAFRAQGAAKLAQYTDPKGLMRDLLGLDETEAQIKKVKLVVREIKRELSSWQDKVLSAKAAREDLVSLMQEERREEASLSAYRAAADSAATAVSLAEHELRLAEAGATDAARVRQEYDAAKALLAGCDERASARRREKGQAIARAGNAAQQTADSYRSSLQQAEQQALVLDKRIVDARKMLAIADRVAASTAAVARLEQDIVQVEQAREALRTRHRRLDAIDAEMRERKAVMARVIGEGRSIAERIAALARMHSFVADVPCKGEGECASCQYLQEAVGAAARIPIEEQAHEAKRKELRDLGDALAQARAKAAEIGERDDVALTAANRNIADMQAALQSERQVAAKAAEIAKAGAVISQATADLVAAKARTEELSAALLAHVRRTRAEAVAHCAEFDADIAELDGAAAAAKASLEAMPKPDNADPTAAARDALRAARERQAGALRAHDESVGVLSSLRSEAAAKRETVKRAAAVEEYAGHVADELALYTLLAIALRGIIDMVIEDSGPSIAATANALLDASYGSRFQVSIVTQRADAQGNLAETFDIEVYDTETGTRSGIVHKSGGESVWLDKALTDAVGLYHQERCGTSYETLFGDEVEDGLTDERKSMFYRMQRATMERGGYQRMFFVSHSQEAWAVADSVIEMESLAK